jgi:hypothetical protein
MKGVGEKKTTVPWGTTTMVRVVNGEGANSGSGGKGKGSFYQVGTRLYSAVPGGGQVGGQVGGETDFGAGPTGTALASGGEEEIGDEASRGGDGMVTTTQMMTTTEREVVTVTATPSPGTTGSTSSAGKMITHSSAGLGRIMVGVGVLASFLVGIGCL